MDKTTGLTTLAALAGILLIVPGCPSSEALEQCETTSDCEADERCVDGYCEPIECETDSDCEVDEACIDGFCEQVECEPTCEEGFDCVHGECLCTSHDACEAWELCVDGECLLDPDAECSPENDCPSGYECVEAVCVCSRDFVCPDGEVCDDGECRAATPCDTDGDCAGEGRICSFGLCVEPCEEPEHCGEPSFLYACLDGRCYSRCLTDDNECPEGFICEPIGQDTVCVEAECATLDDCHGEDQVCTSESHGRCVTVTYCEDDDGCDWTEFCGVPDPCPPGFDCESDTICLGRPTCIGDDDCGDEDSEGYCDRGYCFETSACTDADDCDEGFTCLAEMCVPFVCRGPADCEADEICSGGVCVTADEDAPVDRIEILTPEGHLLEGEERQLVAIAYDNTDRAIVGAPITWSTTHPDSVDVDPTTGVIIGGTEPGAAIITATYGSESAVATWRLLSALEEDEVRITVVDGEGGQPIEGATVRLSTGEEGLTADDGTALFQIEDSEPLDVHAFHEDRDYLSLFAVSSRDILVPLPRRTDSNRAAGVTGSISFDEVSTEGDLAVGLAGTSLAGALPDFDLQRLIGGMFVSEVPMLGEIPLPGAMTAEVTYMGMSIAIKDTYYALGEDGLRMGWAFAGRLSLDRLMSGGGGGMGIASLLNGFGLFEHGLHARVPLAERDKIQDLADINGNGDTDEMVPDWTRFPQRNHTPAQTQNLRLQVSAGQLPELGGSRLDTVVLLGGARAPTMGLVPLGLSATEEMNGDGGLGTTMMRMAPVYGGLEAGGYQIIAMAVPATEDFDVPQETSVRLFNAAQMPEEIQLGDFLAFPEGSSWDESSLTLEHDSIAGAHLLRAVVHGVDRSWHAYTADPGAATITLQLPEVPTGHASLDEPGEASISPIELSSPSSFEDLVHISGPGILSLDEVMSAYSRQVK